MNPTKLALIAIGVLHLQLAVPAATPPPEKLLPADTLAVFTTPDCNKASAAWGTSPWSRLWNDESMRGFATKFEGKFRSTIVQPLEKQLGIKFADYAGFAQGQFTLAVTRNGWDGKPETKPGLLLILDAGNKSADLGKNLATLRQKWTDGGRSVRSTRIRDIEFTTVSISADEIGKMLEQAFPDADAGNENINNDKQDKKDEPAGDKMDITLGMSGSLLIASDTPKDIERVLVLQSGGSMPSLSEDPNFAATAAGFRDATSYAWLDAKTVVEVASAAAAEERPKARRGRRGNDPDISPDKLITTLGLRGLQSASLSSRQTSEGEFATLELRVPAAQRKGIFKLLTAETKDSGPPPFIPGDTVQLSRWRLDLSKFWPQIESMIGDVNPGAVAGIRAALDFVGKDKDPNFDLREQLFNNLGDDIVVAVKNPKERTLMGLNSRPTLTLIGARNPEQVAGAIKSLFALVPGELAGFVKLKEREFLGRKVFWINIPSMGPDGEMTEKPLSFAAGAGYVAFSMDTPMLEEFLRSGEGRGKPLRETPGMEEAAQKVGGLNTGLFIFENQKETMKLFFEVFKKDGGSIASLLAMTPMGARFGGDDAEKMLKDWFDFSQLPAFDAVAKYFHYTVTAGNTTPEGFSLRFFSPNPPGLK